jgi:hypothetical protein
MDLPQRHRALAWWNIRHRHPSSSRIRGLDRATKYCTFRYIRSVAIRLGSPTGLRRKTRSDHHPGYSFSNRRSSWSVPFTSAE